MLGNQEMEEDRDSNVIVTSQVTSSNEIHMISDSTPVEISKKKRKISETTEDITMKTGVSITNVSETPSTPTSNASSSNSIRADLKRLIQSQDLEVSKYYQIKSNNKLILVQGQFGEAPYRNHPDTIKELNSYFNEILKFDNFDNFNLQTFLKEKYSGLIGKLVLDSQVSQSELLLTLKTILIPIASGIPNLSIDSRILDGIVEKVSYGHPKGGNNFSPWSCTFWQVKNIDLLGEKIGKHFLTNYVLRNAARMILENALSERGKEKEDLINIDDLQINLMKIESGTGTPKKRSEKKEKLGNIVNTGNTTISINSNSSNSSNTSNIPNIPIIPSQPQVKISSFFAKLKKPEEKIIRLTGEYFQPFFLKPDVILTPHDQLKLLKKSDGNINEDYLEPSEFWNNFKLQCVKIPFIKETCLCVGYDGQPVRAVLKLIKFEENYRPAYLGTWRKVAPIGSVSARRPFARVPEVDYDYDSDAEWDEGEDPEGESLSDLDDDEEDEEDEDEDEDDTNSCSGSVDNWLVPHGYLSDDEGVTDEVHLGELEDAARESELLPPPPSQKKKEKKKFVPKDPILLGPFFGDQVIPQILQSNSLQFIGYDHTSWNPFINYESVFLGLESSSASAISSSLNINLFPESLLPSMIKIINSNLSAGITKLYDEFTLQNGKAVSRRLFESKLNQITTGKMKCEKSGKLKWTFKNEALNKKTRENEREFDDNNIMIID